MSNISCDNSIQFAKNFVNNRPNLDKDTIMVINHLCNVVEILLDAYEKSTSNYDKLYEAIVDIGKI